MSHVVVASLVLPLFQGEPPACLILEVVIGVRKGLLAFNVQGLRGRCARRYGRERRLLHRRGGHLRRRGRGS